jgi:hypothetical protein
LEDANFRMKNRAHARAEMDPLLGPDMAFAADPVPFGAHIKQYMEKYANKEEVRWLSSRLMPPVLTPPQISDCSGFQALALSSLKLSCGLVATGVSSVYCNHGLWRGKVAT